MNRYSTFEKCIHEAKHSVKEISVSDCLDILIKFYGQRLDYMNSERIYNKIQYLMDITGHSADDQEYRDTLIPYLDSREEKRLLSFGDENMNSTVDVALRIKRILEKEDIEIRIEKIELSSVFTIRVFNVLPEEGRL